MNRSDKIQLIQKHLGAYANEWTIDICLKLLKDYDKKKKAHRIELITKLKK